MHFKNVSKADLTADVSGRTAELIKPNSTFNGFSQYLDTYKSEIEWIAEGFEITGLTYNDFSLNKNVVVNGIGARNVDVAQYDGTGVLTLGVAYSVWGSVTWSDGGVQRTADFSIRGNGNHNDTPGNGVSTFVVEDVAGATVKPVKTSAVFTASTGRIQLGWTGGTPTGKVSTRVQYDWIQVSPRTSFGRDALLVGPSKSKSFTYVISAEQSADGSTGFATGSVGLVKEEREFFTGAQVGDACKLTLYRYKDTINPTKPTHVMEMESKVRATDLLPI